MPDLRHVRVLMLIIIGLGVAVVHATNPAAEQPELAETEATDPVRTRIGGLDDAQVLQLLFGDAASVGDGLTVSTPDLGQVLSSTALVRYLTSGKGHPLEMLRRGPASYRFNPQASELVEIEIGAVANGGAVSGEASGAGVLVIKAIPYQIPADGEEAQPSRPMIVRIRPDRVTISQIVRGVREAIVSEQSLETPITGAVPFSVTLSENTLTARIGTGEATATAQVDSPLLSAAIFSVGAAEASTTIRNGKLMLSLHPEAWSRQRDPMAGRAVLEHVRRRDAQREMLVELIQPSPEQRLALHNSLTPAQRVLLDREDTQALYTALPEHPIVRRLRAVALMRDGRPSAALEVLGGEDAPEELHIPAAAAAIAADRPELAGSRYAGSAHPGACGLTDDQILIRAIADARRVYDQKGVTFTVVPTDFEPEPGSWLERVLNGWSIIQRERPTGRPFRNQRYVGIEYTPEHRRWLLELTHRGLDRVTSALGAAEALAAATKDSTVHSWLAVTCITDPWDFADAMLVLSDQRADMLGGVFVPAAPYRAHQVIVFGGPPGDPEFERVLTHELTHAVIETLYPKAAGLPWLNEGAAVLASASLRFEESEVDHYLPAEAQGRVAEITAYLTGPDAGRRVRALVSMGREDFHQRDSMALNYAASWALVCYAASNPEGFALSDLLTGEVDASKIPAEQLGEIGAAAARALTVLALE